MNEVADRPLTLIQGASGVLGSALLRALRSDAGREVQALAGQGVVASLIDGQPVDFGSLIPPGVHEIDWIYASGVVSPQAPHERLANINAIAPLRLFEQLCRFARTRGGLRARLITLGSVLETRDSIVSQNAYLKSKAQLLKYWKDHHGGPLDWIHFQIHTLYGGVRLHDFMFLGQIEAALKADRMFPMSSGRQLREYHHCDDIALSICATLDSNQVSEVIPLHSGEPIRLSALAASVFEAAGKPHLLAIGALPDQGGEVYDRQERRSPQLIASREPLRGVADWICGRLVGEAAGG